MANERESISLGFGIEETLDTGAAEILQALSAPEGNVTADPDDVTAVTEDDQPSGEDGFVVDTPKSTARTKPKPQTKTPVEKQKPQLEENEEEVNDENYSEILRQSLLGLEEEEQEEEETPTNVQKTTTETTEDETNEEDEPIWSSLSKDLTKLGVFSPEEDEEGNESPFVAKTPEEFKEKFINEIKIQAQNVVEGFVSKYGEKHRDAFEAIYIKGVDPQQYFSKATEITSFKELDLEEEKNQEAIVRKALQEQDLEADDIDKEIARLKNYGDLETVSKRFHKSLVKKEEASLARLAEEKQAEIKRQQEIDEQYENNVYNIIREKYQSKDFDGIPVNKQFAEKTMDYLTTKKYKLPSGELLSEFDKEILESKRPENHQIRVKLAMLMQLIKNDPTLSTIKKRAVSNESNEAFQEVVRHKSKKQTAVVKAKPKSFFD